MYDGVRKIASALNHLYLDKIGYGRDLVNRPIASSERSRLLVVQDRVVGYVEELSRKA